MEWGAPRPQTPRRSPRQAFGGNSSRPQGGEQTKTKTLRNPQNFSYEVSHPRVHARSSSADVARCGSVDSAAQRYSGSFDLACGEALSESSRARGRDRRAKNLPCSPTPSGERFSSAERRTVKSMLCLRNCSFNVAISSPCRPRRSSLRPPAIFNPFV